MPPHMCGPHPPPLAVSVLGSIATVARSVSTSVGLSRCPSFGFCLEMSKPGIDGLLQRLLEGTSEEA